jgi:CopG family transcriptional regulator, nickel-responsive regulator
LGGAVDSVQVLFMQVMAEKLVRFGVAMEASLLEEFDRLVESRGGTRSEALRDLARAAVSRALIRRGHHAVGTLTLVYDHHVRDLTEKLTELQHDLGDRVRSTLHIHLDHALCLEVVVMHGRSDELQDISERIIALKGVKHGAIELYVDAEGEGEHASHDSRHPALPHAHAHPHSHASRPPRKRAKAAARPLALRAGAKRSKK